jgi:hypothetical protein
MNKKAKTIFWIVSVAVAVLMMSLMSGCYLKDNNDPGFKYYDQGKNSSNLTDKDLSTFASSLRKFDGHAVANYKMALYFQKQKKHNLAIEELKEAVGRDSSYAKAYNAMGVSYDKLRKYGRANDCYRLALAIDPNLDYVHNNLGYSYLLSDNLDAAIESFQKAIQLNDRNKRYHKNLALVYVMKDRYDLAIDQLKVLEGGPHAGETVAKLAHKLGKKDFEKQIVSVLERMALERAMGKKAKPVPGKSAVIEKKFKKQETEAGSRKPVVISGKNEQHAPKTDNSEIADNPAPGAPEPEGTKTFENEMALEKDASNSQFSESKDPYGHKHIWESWKEMPDEIEEQAENNPVISATSEAGQVPALVVREKPNAAFKNDQQPANGDQKISDQTILLSAVEIQPQPASEKPVPIEKESRGGNLSPSSKVIAQDTAKRPQTQINPRVVDVAEAFKHTGKDTENTLPAQSAAKLVPVGVAKRNSTTLKISPAYVASASPSKKTDGRGLPVIEILPARKDEKIMLAARPAEIKPEKPDKHIVEVEIANGNGVTGMAARVRNILKENGFKVVKITNANSFDHLSTKILYYNGHFQDVDRIIQQIACCADERNIIELKHLGNRLKIIIGKDLSPQDRKKAKRGASGDQS